MPAFALDSPKAIKGKELMEDKWERLEEIVRRVVKEEIASLGKKPKINLVNGKWVGITQEQMTAWSDAYPGVEIDAEIKRAAAWCLSNPTNSPKSEFGRYLNSWFGREQNRSAIRSIPADRKTEHKQKHCEYCPRVATGSVGGLWHCPEHVNDAMDRRPRAHMLGVVPKPVAGRD